MTNQALEGVDPATNQPPTIAMALDRVGTTLLRVLTRSPRLDRPAKGIVIYDPRVPLEAATDHVLLGVGIDPDSSDALDLIAEAQKAGCAAVVLRTDDDVPKDVIVSARQHDVLLLASSTAASWVHLGTMLRMSVGAGATDRIAGLPIGDLFGFVNALSSTVGGAVTLEDSESRVMAYSSLVGDVDEPRKLTILGRQVPVHFMELLNSLGVMERLAATDQIVHMDPMPELGLHGRIAISVRAAGELLGFLWVAEAGQPLADDAERVLREAAQAAALHIVRERLNQRKDSDVRRELLRTLLEGGPSSDVNIATLGLRHGVSYCVIAFEVIGARVSTEQAVHAIETYCVTYSKESLVGSVGMRIYALVPNLTSTTVRGFVAAGIERVQNALHVPVKGSFSSSPRSVDHIAEMRTDADRAMRVLMRRPPEAGIASLDDVRSETAVLEITDFLRDKPHLLDGKLSALLHEPTLRDQALIDTLICYLDHFGDIGASAAFMHIHVNTFRYRLTRVVEVTGLDLSNPSERLVAQLQLQVATKAGQPVGALDENASS